VDGVVHSAGVLGDGAIHLKTPQEVDEVLRPKVGGTLVLDTVFRDAPLDFLLLFSSLSAVKPGFGQVAYSAANNFLDAFAHTESARSRGSVTCLSWDVWQGEGMAYDATAPRAIQQLKEADFRQRGILPHEGVEVVGRVLNSGLAHVMVATSDYLTSTDRDLSSLYLETAKGALAIGAAHARPSLDTAYAPPGTETELTLTAIWQELLGIDGIGIDDDFFHLGGDSLIGTQLTARIRTGFGVKLPIKSIYLHRTVRSMSAEIEEALVSGASPEMLDEVLRQLEGLS
jgi:acyl carrier protein